jgi:hypothetical protein
VLLGAGEIWPAASRVDQLTKAIVIDGMLLSGGAACPMLGSTLRKVEVGIGEPLFVAVLLIEFTHCRPP